MGIMVRATIGFVVLLIAVRIIGNKQLGQLNVFTYISGIAVGSMVAEIILHNDLNLWVSMLGVAVWAALTIGIEMIAMKSVRVRELFDGQPVILIKKGLIMYSSLKKERLNIDDLTMMLRTNSVFSILDVDYAILEPNGDLSILKKKEKDNITKEDMQIMSVHQTNLPTAVILDGRIITKNLTELNLTEEWMINVLNGLGARNKADVLYAELQGDGRLYVQLKDGDVRIG